MAKGHGVVRLRGLASGALVLACLTVGLYAAAEPAIVDAAKRGDVAAVRAALNRKSDPNASAADGTTALHHAAYRGDAELARLLIERGAKARAANRYGVEPLTLAATNGHTAVMAQLLAAGADANGRLPDGETVLLTASRSGVVEAVKLLLVNGADPNATEPKRKQTALMWAAAEGHAGVVRTLVEGGADLRAKSNSGFTPLLFAAREGRIDVVKALLDLGASPTESLSVNSARSAGGVEVGQREANLDAFLLASGNAHFELAAYLLDRGADANVAPRGWTALHQISWVRKTGEAGGNDPPPQGSGRMTSLEFVKTLVTRGADVNARVTNRRLPVGTTSLNFTGATPFLLAARTADVPLMRLLIELGADPLAMSSDRSTPLMIAAGVGAGLPGEEPGTEAEVIASVELLLQRGSDINAVNANGDTAMHGAAYKHLPAVVRFLGEHGARIEIWNTKNKAGHTPLDVAKGIQRGMNFVFSTETEAAIRSLMPAGN
jgi:ankyrin repeat protein